MKPLHIFKAGRQTAMSGTAISFSEADLAASAAAYDPAKHEAPIVIGHPQTDDPAYGWVKSLQCDANGLFAEPAELDEAFAELVKAGRFKKISASFYLPDSPANPVPGSYYLRHVGFLGAQPPAVKGLKQAEFAAGDEGVIEFADWDDVQNASLWRGLRDWIINKFGLDEADKALPGYGVSSLEAAAQQEPDDCADPSYAEPNPAPKETTVTPEQAAALQAQNAALQAELAKTKAAARRVEYGEFLTGLVKEGKLLPAQQGNALAFMESLSAEQIIEFSEGDTKTSQTQADAFKTLLKCFPKQVEFSELAGGDLPHEPDTNANAIAEKARKIQAEAKAAGTNINFAEAVTRATAATKGA